MPRDWEHRGGQLGDPLMGTHGTRGLAHLGGLGHTADVTWLSWFNISTENAMPGDSRWSKTLSEDTAGERAAALGAPRTLLGLTATSFSSKRRSTSGYPLPGHRGQRDGGQRVHGTATQAWASWQPETYCPPWTQPGLTAYTRLLTHNPPALTPPRQEEANRHSTA